MRFPGNVVAKAFMRGITRSAFVSDAVAALGDWEAAYRRLEANEALPEL